MFLLPGWHIIEPVEFLGSASIDAPDETFGVTHVSRAPVGPNLAVAQLGESEDAKP
jgi:hypothetical protein